VGCWSPLGTAATNRPIIPAPSDYDDREIGGKIGRGNRSTRRKPSPAALCPPQTPLAALMRNRAVAMGINGLSYVTVCISLYSHFKDKTDPNAMEILEFWKIMMKWLPVNFGLRNTVIFSSSATFLWEYFYYSSEYSDEFRGYHPCGLKEMSVLVTDLLMTLQKRNHFLNHMNNIIDRLIESGITAYLGT
jgi:hypothetical protein